MTDRHTGYVVVLERDIREDDAAESVLLALRSIRGVLSVEPVISDPGQAISDSRARYALADAIRGFLEGRK